jgi:uncharacterized protein (TIGR00369 family)
VGDNLMAEKHGLTLRYEHSALFGVGRADAGAGNQLEPEATNAGVWARREKSTAMQQFEPQDPAWEARVRASFAQQSLMSTLNAELLDLAPGRSTIRSTYREGLGQQNGFFHAGVASAIGDTACGYAAYTLFPPDTNVLSAEFNINLLAPAKGRELVATAEVVRAGRRLSVCLARIEVDPAAAGGQLCAIMLATIALVKHSRRVR